MSVHSTGVGPAHVTHGNGHASSAAAHPATGMGSQNLSIQFENLDQQNESYVVGMWTFLVTEIMFFGALFLCYSIYRVLYPDIYLDAHKFLSIPLGTLNTFVLLTSSLAMALAVHAAQVGKRYSLIGWLSITMGLSVVFLGVKAVEYTSKINEGLLPGPTFDYAKANRMHDAHGAGHGSSSVEEAQGHGSGSARAHTEQQSVPEEESRGVHAGGNQNRASGGAATASAGALPGTARAEQIKNNRAQLFFSIYFAMTGLHAVHIIIGILMMSALAGLALIKRPEVDDYMPTEMVGLYWHFVDIVWIFLFPLLYLIS